MEWELLPLPLFLIIIILLNSVIALAGDGSDAVNDWMAIVFSWCRRHDVSCLANASKEWRENVTKRFDETFAGRLFPQHGPID